MRVFYGYDSEGNEMWDDVPDDSYNYDYGYDTTPQQGTPQAWVDWANNNVPQTPAPAPNYTAGQGNTDPYAGTYDPNTNTYSGTTNQFDTAKLLAAIKAANEVPQGGANTSGDWGTKLLDFLKTNEGKALLAGGVGAAIGYNSAAKPSGGGITKRYVSPTQQLTRTVEQGRYGPIAQFKQAADGGVMHAYKHGGQVAMEDGGFVMTKRAVDGAGGPQGIQRLVPGARPIRGPGTGTSDSIPAYIQGPRGRTPAAVSNGEAYVPRQTVQQNGGPQRMYALMNQLQRRRG